MPRLPVLSGQDTVRNFERFGWNVARQRGSGAAGQPHSDDQARRNGDPFSAESPNRS